MTSRQQAATALGNRLLFSFHDSLLKPLPPDFVNFFVLTHSLTLQCCHYNNENSSKVKKKKKNPLAKKSKSSNSAVTMREGEREEGAL
jgi:hypothetical protein